MPSNCPSTTEIGESLCEGGAGPIGCQRTDEHTTHFNRTHCRVGHSWRDPRAVAIRDRVWVDLYETLTEHINYFDHDHRAAVDVLVAEGWGPAPRKIKTLEELDELYNGTIVRVDGSAWERTPDWWYGTGYPTPRTSKELILLATADDGDAPDITLLFDPRSHR